jgi:outer membrane protein OmpA-like peptidoglycan-associated protein
MRKTYPFHWCFLLLGLLWLPTLRLHAQDFLGLENSNYAGINGVFLQPASIVDSRYKVDICLVGAGATVVSNYIGVDSRRLLSGKTNPWQGLIRLDSSQKRVNIIAQQQVILPSFMFQFRDRSALAFQLRQRTIVNLFDMDEGIGRQLMSLALGGTFDATRFSGQYFNNDRLSLQLMSWIEAGLTYGRVFVDQDRHMLKAALSLKYLQGAGAIYVDANNLNAALKLVNSTTIDSISLVNGSSVDYGYALPVNPYSPRINYTGSPSRYGFSGDIGFVYEYRRKQEKYTYTMDGEDGRERRDQEKYIVRVGLSLTDVGAISYLKGALSSTLQVNALNAAQTAVDWGVQGVKFKDISDFNTQLNKAFGSPGGGQPDFWMWLPTRLSLQVDVRACKWFYVNLTTLTSFRASNKSVQEQSLYSIAPRIDFRWFGMSVPLAINHYSQFTSGVSFRFGPLWLGVNTMFTNLGLPVINNVNFNMAVKIPIFYPRPKDKDKDKVSNKLDVCPKVPGLWEFLGCPDTDGDGVQDSNDPCPLQKGSIYTGGCPDRDNDGVIDKKDICPDDSGRVSMQGCPDFDGDNVTDSADACPDLAGLLKYNGCPDSDEDGITDDKDSCVNIPGPLATNGCPDRDGDGVVDPSDDCPDVPGVASARGCPDKDGDGIMDKDDACPDKPGEATHFGCPDTDKDGVYDNDDACPDKPGPAQNNGCPLVEVAQKRDDLQEKLRTAFENLEFQTGSAVISPVSLPSLADLAKVLNKNTGYKLAIEGHTDNVGYPAANLALSLARANAVKQYLSTQGVDIGRIKATGYGDTRPVAQNTTPAGRSRNRRVEMRLE